MHPEPGDPAALLDELAAETADMKVEARADGVSYSRAGGVFAVRSTANAVELRLGAEIGEAAQRTPATTASERGPDWVRFEPTTWDGHALDRLEAWFRVAWRLAAPH